MVITSGNTVETMAARLDRLNSDPVADTQVLDSRAKLGDFTAQLVAHDDGIFHAGQGMRSGPRRDRAVVVLVQIAAADAVEQHPQLHLARARGRLGDLFEAQILIAVENSCAHE